MSILSPFCLGVMSTNNAGTCAAAFLFLDGSAVPVFAQGGFGLFLRTRLLQVTTAVSGSSAGAGALHSKFDYASFIMSFIRT